MTRYRRWWCECTMGTIISFIVDIDQTYDFSVKNFFNFKISQFLIWYIIIWYILNEEKAHKLQKLFHHEIKLSNLHKIHYIFEKNFR